MKRKITLAIQVLFDLIILATGINKIYLLMPVPEQTPAANSLLNFYRPPVI